MQRDTPSPASQDASAHEATAMRCVDANVLAGSGTADACAPSRKRSRSAHTCTPPRRCVHAAATDEQPTEALPHRCCVDEVDNDDDDNNSDNRLVSPAAPCVTTVPFRPPLVCRRSRCSGDDDDADDDDDEHHNRVEGSTTRVCAPAVTVPATAARAVTGGGRSVRSAAPLLPPACHAQAATAAAYVSTLFATAAGVPMLVSETAMQRARLRFSQDTNDNYNDGDGSSNNNNNNDNDNSDSNNSNGVVRCRVSMEASNTRGTRQDDVATGAVAAQVATTGAPDATTASVSPRPPPRVRPCASWQTTRQLRDDHVAVATTSPRVAARQCALPVQQQQPQQQPQAHVKLQAELCTRSLDAIASSPSSSSSVSSASRTVSVPTADTTMQAVPSNDSSSSNSSSSVVLRGSLGGGGRRRGFVPPMQRAAATRPFASPLAVTAPAVLAAASAGTAVTARVPASERDMAASSSSSHPLVRLRFDAAAFTSTWPRDTPLPSLERAASCSGVFVRLCCSPLLRALLGIAATEAYVDVQHWRHLLLRLGAAASHCSLAWCTQAVAAATTTVRSVAAAAVAERRRRRRRIDKDDDDAVDTHADTHNDNACRRSHSSGTSCSDEDEADATRCAAVFTPTSVALQLCALYNREVVDGVRSALRQVVEGDVPAASLMVLQMTGVCEERLAPHTRVVRVCDGAYEVKASLDVPLTSLLREGVLVAGQRLAVCGAKNLAQAQSTLLDSTQACVLALNYNCVRAVDACTPLGLCYAEPAPLPLPLVHPLGGLVPALCGTVVRVLPAFFVTQTAPLPAAAAPRQATMPAGTARTRTRKVIRNAYAFRQYATAAAAAAASCATAAMPTSAPGHASGALVDDGAHMNTATWPRAPDAPSCHGMNDDNGSAERGAASRGAAEELTRVVSIVLRGDDGAEALVQQWRTQLPLRGDGDTDDADASADVDMDALPAEGSVVVVYALNPSRSQSATAPFAHAKLFYSSRSLHFLLRAPPSSTSASSSATTTTTASSRRVVHESFCVPSTTAMVSAQRLGMGVVVDFVGVYVGVGQSAHGTFLLFALRDDTYALLQVPLPSDTRMLALPIPAAYGSAVLVQNGTFLTYADPVAGSDCVRVVANEYTTLTQNPARPYLRQVLAGMHDVVSAVAERSATSRKYRSRSAEIFRCVCGRSGDDATEQTATATAGVAVTVATGKAAWTTRTTAVSVRADGAPSSRTAVTLATAATARAAVDAAAHDACTLHSTGHDGGVGAGSETHTAGLTTTTTATTTTTLTTTATATTAAVADASSSSSPSPQTSDDNMHGSHRLVCAAIDCDEALRAAVTRPQTSLPPLTRTRGSVDDDNAAGTHASSDDKHLPYYLRRAATPHAEPEARSTRVAMTAAAAAAAAATVKVACAAAAMAARTTAPSACLAHDCEGHDRHPTDTSVCNRDMNGSKGSSSGSGSSSSSHRCTAGEHGVHGARASTPCHGMGRQGSRVATMVYGCVMDMSVQRSWLDGQQDSIVLVEAGAVATSVLATARAAACDACASVTTVPGAAATARASAHGTTPPVTGPVAVTATVGTVHADDAAAVAVAAADTCALTTTTTMTRRACTLTCTMQLRCCADVDAGVATWTVRSAVVRDCAVLESMLGAVANARDVHAMLRLRGNATRRASVAVAVADTALMATSKARANAHETAADGGGDGGGAAASADGAEHACWWWHVLSTVSRCTGPRASSQCDDAHAPCRDISLAACEHNCVGADVDTCLRVLAHSMLRAVWCMQLGVGDDGDEVCAVRLVAADGSAFMSK